MAPSAFMDKKAQPGEEGLREVLGAAAGAWDALVCELGARHGPVEPRWGYSGKAYGWSLSLRWKSRPLVYLSPGNDRFTASLALGETAYGKALAADLPPSVRATLETATLYPEGRAVRLDVLSTADLPPVLLLVGIRASS